MRMTPDGNSLPVPDGPAREVIDADDAAGPTSPDGFEVRDAYRAVWQTARHIIANPEPPAAVTPWMRMSDEEKDRIRARRRLRAVAPAEVDSTAVEGREAA